MSTTPPPPSDGVPIRPPNPPAAPPAPATDAPPAAPAPSSPTFTGGDEAEIFDRGYRRYEGRRTGVTGSIRTLAKHSARRALGLRRSARHKILPIMVVVFAYLPGTAFVGLAALLPDDAEDLLLPSYAEYYGFVSAAIFLFAAFVAPELLCTDRRTGMLGLYLASPLERRTYLAGKGLATVGILALVTTGPPLLLLIALTIEGAGPDTLSDGLSLLWRILLSGVVVTSVYTAISLAVSATTDRKGGAMASIVGIIVGSSVVAAVLVDSLDQPSLRLISMLGLPLQLVFRIHGESGDPGWSEVSTSAMTITVIAVTLAGLAWTWDRYRRLTVRR